MNKPDESVSDEISEEPPLPRHQEGHDDEPEGQRRHRARPHYVAQAGEGRRAASVVRGFVIICLRTQIRESVSYFLDLPESNCE